MPALRATTSALELSKRPDAMRAWLEWEACGPEERDPPTIVALAVKLGVSEQAIRNWRGDPRLNRDRQGALARKVLGYLPEVVVNLARKAADPDSSPAGAAACAKVLSSIVIDDREDADAVAAAAGAVTDAKHLTSEQLRDLSDALAVVADEVDGKPVPVDV
jgi:hypothetical protein